MVLTHSSISSELQSHSTAGNLPTSLSGVKKPQEKITFLQDGYVSYGSTTIPATEPEMEQKYMPDSRKSA